MTKKLNIKNALFAGLFGLGIFSNELNANDYTGTNTIDKYYNNDLRNIISNKIKELIPAKLGVEKFSFGVFGRSEERLFQDFWTVALIFIKM